MLTEKISEWLMILWSILFAYLILNMRCCNNKNVIMYYLCKVNISLEY